MYRIAEVSAATVIMWLLLQIRCTAANSQLAIIFALISR